ncbi:MAG: dockerin type I domain-containing protein [Planctomycetota bacterium]|nr:dockerin type I domain-containing protein [Planctomycetota bacterium]
MKRFNRLGALVITVVTLISGPAVGDIIGTSLLGHWDGFDGSYADVWADGQYVYLGHYGTSEVDIIDISDPANPTPVAEYILPPTNTGASAQDVKVADGLLFISLEGAGNSVHIVDVRDPENPVGLVDIAIDDFTLIHNTFYHEGFLYLADSHTPRVGIVDLTDFDPDNPPANDITDLRWLLTDVGTSFVHDVTVIGDRAYVSAWDSGIRIYDVSNLAEEPPTLLGSGPGENTHSCWPTDDGRFVITGEERTGGGIIVYRIIEDDGSSVTLEVTDSVALPPDEASSVHNQVAIGYRVYNSWYGAGLRIYDVDPATGLLEFAASYDTPEIGAAWGVYPFLGPHRVLMSDISDGLFVIRVETPMGDVNGDGVVNTADLLQLLAEWGPCANCASDVNGDGVVDTADLLALLAGWS